MLQKRSSDYEAKIAGPIARILEVQRANGMIPWFEDGPWDSWNHGECVMALAIAGEKSAARLGLDALANEQRRNGGFLCEYGNALPMADHVSIARVDTLPEFRRTLRLAKLDEAVVPMVGRSTQISAFWGQPCGMVFIDGGHTIEAALEDLRGWGSKVARGGTLAIHDVFPDPADGGRPPFEIYQMALASNLFEEVLAVKSLRLLKRV